MHEDKFNIIEGRQMTLESLGHELEQITGLSVRNFKGDASRSVANKPNNNQDFETFNARYDFKDSEDFVDTVFTVKKENSLEDYNFDEAEVTVQLITYKRVDAPKENESDKISE